MKYIEALLLSTFIFPCISHAAVVDFPYPSQASYDDDTGIASTLITGSSSGEQTGKFVKSLADIQIEIQSVDFSENFITVLHSTETKNHQDFSQASSVSLGVALDSFILSDSGHSIEVTDANSIIQAANDGIEYTDVIDINSSLNTSWGLVERNVPEPSILILLSLGFVSIAMHYVRKSSY